MPIKNSLLGFRLYLSYINKTKNDQEIVCSADGNSKWDVQTKDNANLINQQTVM
jgi:hypothetical protein